MAAVAERAHRDGAGGVEQFVHAAVRRADGREPARLPGRRQPEHGHASGALAHDERVVVGEVDPVRLAEAGRLE